jgi:hypothetical protein
LDKKQKNSPCYRGGVVQLLPKIYYRLVLGHNRGVIVTQNPILLVFGHNHGVIVTQNPILLVFGHNHGVIVTQNPIPLVFESQS